MSKFHSFNEIFILRTELFNSTRATMVSSLALLIIFKSSSWARDTSLGYSRDVAEYRSQWKQAPLSTLKNFLQYLRFEILKRLFGFQLL